MRIATMAETAQIRIAPHNPGAPLGTATVAHAMSILPNFAILEFMFGDVPWRGDLITPAESIVDGYYTVPDGPGLGVTLNEAVFEAHESPIPAYLPTN